MIKIRTKEPVYYGLANHEKGYTIESELREIARSEANITFRVTDTATDNGLVVATLRDKQHIVTIDDYNALHNHISQNLPENLTPFEREILVKKEGFLHYFTNDKINGKCLYNTIESDWEII